MQRFVRDERNKVKLLETKVFLLSRDTTEMYDSIILKEVETIINTEELVTNGEENESVYIDQSEKENTDNELNHQSKRARFKRENDDDDLVEWMEYTQSYSENENDDIGEETAYYDSESVDDTDTDLFNERLEDEFAVNKTDSSAKISPVDINKELKELTPEKNPNKEKIDDEVKKDITNNHDKSVQHVVEVENQKASSVKNVAYAAEKSSEEKNGPKEEKFLNTIIDKLLEDEDEIQVFDKTSELEEGCVFQQVPEENAPNAPRKTRKRKKPARYSDESMDVKQTRSVNNKHKICAEVA